MAIVAKCVADGGEGPRNDAWHAPPSRHGFGVFGKEHTEAPWIPIREHLRALSPEALRETYREVEARGQSVSATANLLLHALTMKYFATKLRTDRWSSQHVLDAGMSFLHTACLRDRVIRDVSYACNVGHAEVGATLAVYQEDDNTGGYMINVEEVVGVDTSDKLMQVANIAKNTLLSCSNNICDSILLLDRIEPNMDLSYPLIFSRTKMQLGVGASLRRVAYNES